MPKFELPDSFNSIIENTTKDLTVNAGKTFGDIWFLIFGGISRAADKRHAKYAHDLAIYEQELSASITKIPEDKRTEPSLQITAQALENSKYCIDEKELRKMFTALICNSMNSDFSKDIHPSFAEIIKQMSVLDAKIMNLYKQDNARIGLPVCQYIPRFPGLTPSTPAPEHIFLELPDSDMLLCSLAISSLEGLGLVAVSYNHILSTPNVYDKFEQHPFYKVTAKSVPIMDMDIKKGVVSPTPLGRSFIKVCIPD